MLENIANKVPMFKSLEQKQNFVEVIGALSLRLISLAKAAEIMKMEKEEFLTIIENYGYEFSFLDKSDIEIERAGL
jgi:predicted HTH domain antitoxin